MASKTNEQFLAESKPNFPQIEVLSEYKSSKEMMTFRCTKHDYVFQRQHIVLLTQNVGVIYVQMKTL